MGSGKISYGPTDKRSPVFLPHSFTFHRTMNMFSARLIRSVKKREDAKKILQEYDEYMQKVKYPPVKVHHDTMLCLAVESNHLDLVKGLIQTGVDVNFPVSGYLTTPTQVLQRNVAT